MDLRVGLTDDVRAVISAPGGLSEACYPPLCFARPVFLLPVANAHYAAISVSNAGDADGTSVFADGNAPDAESNLECQSVSVAVSALSSPVQPTRPLEITAAQLAEAAIVETPSLPEAEVPALSEADFPALPSSQPAMSSKAQGKRPAVSARSAESKGTGTIRKTPLNKRILSPASLKFSTQDNESPTSTELSPSLVIGRDSAPRLSVKKETKDPSPPTRSPSAPATSTENVKQANRPAPKASNSTSPEIPTIAPFLSRKTRKVKAAPIIKAPKKTSKDVSLPAEEADTPETDEPADSVDSMAVAPDEDVTPMEPGSPSYTQPPFGAPASLSKLLNDVGRYLDVEGLTFFDTGTINTKGQSNIRYAPLVHALSTLSSGTSFTGSMPNSSIDSAVSSFQQLLETLTQTISDILHLLPRNTWDDSSSFDGVLREMLRAEDLLDEVNENGEIRDDEVASLTMALEKRARWMEHQLTKLEDLHRDINSAAVRAVLSINDRGWDATGFLPRQGDSLANFDAIGQEEVDGRTTFMSVEELEESLADAKAKEAAAEAELRQMMHRNVAQLWLA